MFVVSVAHKRKERPLARTVRAPPEIYTPSLR